MMSAALNSDMQMAVADAVRLVNSHSGQASVRLKFNSGDVPELDFVANSARVLGDRFVFTAGFETFDGSIRELADIHAELIRR